MQALAGGAVVIPGVGQVLQSDTNSAKLGGEMPVMDIPVGIGADTAAWWGGVRSCSLSLVTVGMVAKLSVCHFYKELNKVSHRSNNSTFITYSSAFLWSSSLYFKKFLKAERVRVVFWNLVFQMKYFATRII